MQSVVLFISLFFSGFALSSTCEVYGISDSPQKLSCEFSKLSAELTCRGGNYYINGEKIDVAFHYEVEDGPVPLVFKNDELELIVLMKSPRIDAELVINGSSLHGTCKK